MSDNLDRTRLLKSKQYLANDDSLTYGSWENIAGREHAHALMKTDEPATLVIVGQVSPDRLSFGPLGTYQTQEEKDYNNSYRMECKDTKFSLNLQRPSETNYPDWAEDYDDATANVEALQELIASGTAPRLWFLEKVGDQKRLRFVRNIWEKKDFLPDTSDNDDTASADQIDDEYNDRKSYAISKAECTNNYVVPARFKDTFESVAEEYNVDLPPVFFSTGKLVPISQLAIRLPNAIVEVMFTIKHYLISDNKKNTSRVPMKNATIQNSNTFTATFDQIRILHSSNKPKKAILKRMATVTEDNSILPRKRKQIEAKGKPNDAKANQSVTKGKGGANFKRQRKNQTQTQASAETSKAARTNEHEPLEDAGTNETSTD